MLCASISVLILLLHCAPHEVTADTNEATTAAATTITPEPTTTPETTTATTQETTTATTQETTTAATPETTTATTPETTTATTPETTTATTPETTTATTPETTTATTPETTTATTPETTTARTPETTTAETTESPSPTVSPGYMCCDTFVTTDAPTTPLIPSDKFVINASCSCNTNNKTYCPEIIVDDEAKEFVSFTENFLEDKQNSCVIQVTIKPLLNKFQKHSIEVPLIVYEVQTPHPLTVRFQKSDNQEACKLDLDCWHSLDQICDKERCSCYQDIPVFIRMEEQCYPASKYGEICKYNEQCMSSDNKTTCSDEHKRCKCMDGYWTKSVSDSTCINSLSPNVIANQFMVYFTAIASVILISRMM